jgi:hypothetical protein
MTTRLVVALTNAAARAVGLLLPLADTLARRYAPSLPPDLHDVWADVGDDPIHLPRRELDRRTCESIWKASHVK